MSSVFSAASVALYDMLDLLHLDEAFLLRNNGPDALDAVCTYCDHDGAHHAASIAEIDAPGSCIDIPAAPGEQDFINTCPDEILESIFHRLVRSIPHMGAIAHA